MDLFSIFTLCGGLAFFLYGISLKLKLSPVWKMSPIFGIRDLETQNNASLKLLQNKEMILNMHRVLQ